MPGKHINDQQVRLYMKQRITRSQGSAAAMAGISVAGKGKFRLHTFFATKPLWTENGITAHIMSST